jgi:DNA mismatch endonuclease, patch repair protein
VDRLTPEHRSWNMSRIRGRDTQPERAVRSALHRAGYRFRLHRKDLPGRPDIVLPKHRTVVFVHGCFWHRHPGCRFAYTPKSRADFWAAKFLANVERDQRNRRDLRRLGWRVITVWECQTGLPGRWLRKL